MTFITFSLIRLNKKTRARDSLLFVCFEVWTYLCAASNTNTVGHLLVPSSSLQCDG